MKYKIEFWLNIIIGVVLINNLYLLTGITKIPVPVFILFSLIVSLYYFIKRFYSDVIINLVNNQIVFLYILFSVILLFVDLVLYQSSIVINDVLRVILYAVYFSWVVLLLKNNSDKNKWYLIIAVTSIILLTVQGIFEYFQPFIYSLFLSSNVEKRVLGRVAATLIDSNAFCGVIIIMFIVFYYKKLVFIKSNIPMIILSLLVIILNEMAGSRQGLLMYLLFLFFIIKDKITIKTAIITSAIIFISVFVVILNWGLITEYAVNNPSSTLSRIVLSDENPQAIKSNMERTRSLTEGLNFVVDNYFFLNPGMFCYADRWNKYTDSNEPHNGLIYLASQFGLFAFFVFYLFFQSFKRALKTNNTYIYLVLMLHMALQPNLIFYALYFFVLMKIDDDYLELNTALE
ncbi:MAG: hypothetical protein ACK4K9_04585 [Bacteroidia bacterium]